MEREQVMNVLNHIDPALIEAADLPVKARKPRWTRIALTAACLCLALLGVVYAVESAGVRITFFEEEQLADRSLPGYQIEIAPDYIPLEQLSEEVGAIRADVDIIKKVVTTHSVELDKLGKAR